MGIKHNNIYLKTQNAYFKHLTKLFINKNSASPWQHHLGQDFKTLSLLTFGARQFSAVGGYPVHCEKLTSISGLHLLDADSIPSPHPHGWDDQKLLHILPSFPWRSKPPPVKNHWTQVLGAKEKGNQHPRSVLKFHINKTHQWGRWVAQSLSSCP